METSCHDVALWPYHTFNSGIPSRLIWLIIIMDLGGGDCPITVMIPYVRRWTVVLGDTCLTSCLCVYTMKCIISSFLNIYHLFDKWNMLFLLSRSESVRNMYNSCTGFGLNFLWSSKSLWILYGSSQIGNVGTGYSFRDWNMEWSYLDYFFRWCDPVEFLPRLWLIQCFWRIALSHPHLPPVSHWQSHASATHTFFFFRSGK
jgi:hypothetical protein